MARLEIEVGEPKRIIRHYGHFPFVYLLSDGRLILRACCGDDTNVTEAEYEEICSDGLERPQFIDILSGRYRLRSKWFHEGPSEKRP